MAGGVADEEAGQSQPADSGLLRAAAAEIGQYSPDLAHAYRQMSRRYRRPAPATAGADDVPAYLAARLPATYAAACGALAAIAELLPGWRPASLLDLGAGPGTGTWAAAHTFPSIGRVTLVELSRAMITMGRRLAASSVVPAVRGAEWRRGSAVTATLPSADLVIACYLLGELEPQDARRATARWWDATAGELLIVEPGTPAGFRRILLARTQLVAAGAMITAPCPSGAACPMAGSDWCHFSMRLARSSLHRTVKSAARGFEDEKYSYIAVSRHQSSHARARVLRQPLTRSGHIRLTVCEAPAMRELTVARSDREGFRWARHAKWGDAVPPEVLSAAARGER